MDREDDKRADFPRPDTQLNVLRRYLHVLALLQVQEDGQNWNASTLADILSVDEPGDVLEAKSIRDYINDYLVNELGLDIEKKPGGRKTGLAVPIEKDLLMRLAMVYANFVAVDSSREIILTKLAQAHPHDALWLLGRIYLATRERRRITFDYTTNSNAEIHGCAVHPYHLVFRNNNLYLAALSEYSGKIQLFIVNRITGLEVTGSSFPEEIPAVGDIFRDTLGSFIGRKYNVVIRFSEEARIQLEQILSILEPEISEDERGWLRASFTSSDETFLCKLLIPFGSSVEILEPITLREKMLDMLRQSLSVYE